MIKRNSFTCREIAKDDISAYERFLLTKAREENPNYDDYADERSYKSFFYKASSLTANPAKIVFGLFEGDKIIGHTQINTAQTLFNDTYLLKSYRRNGLSSLFYEARIAHVKDNNLFPVAQMEILEDNTPSLRAAARHGFVVVGERPINGAPAQLHLELAL